MIEIDFNSIPIYQAWVPLAIMAASAIAGALANRKKARTTETTQQIQQEQKTEQKNIFDRLSTTDMTTMPQYTSEDEALKNYISGRLRARAEQPFDLRGYAATAMQNINRGAAARASNLQNVMRARGMSYSPVAATAPGAIDAERLASIGNMWNQLPMMQYGLEKEALGDLSSFFGQLPFGQRQTGTTSETGTSSMTGTTTGTTNMTGTNVAPGSVAAGAMGGFGQGLASTYGWKWALDEFMKKRNPTGGSNVAMNMSQIQNMLAALSQFGSTR